MHMHPTSLRSRRSRRGWLGFLVAPWFLVGAADPAGAYSISPSSLQVRGLEVDIRLIYSDPEGVYWEDSALYSNHWGNPECPDNCYGPYQRSSTQRVDNPYDGSSFFTTTVGQNSNVTGSYLSGSGSASFHAELLDLSAVDLTTDRSVFDVPFSLTERVHYDLTGVLSSASLSLTGPGIDYSTSADGSLARAGHLSPGVYHMFVETNIQMPNPLFGPTTFSTASSWSFDFSVVPTPEPTTGVLVAVGLALAVRVGRSRSIP